MVSPDQYCKKYKFKKSLLNKSESGVLLQLSWKLQTIVLFQSADIIKKNSEPSHWPPSGVVCRFVDASSYVQWALKAVRSCGFRLINTLMLNYKLWPDMVTFFVNSQYNASCFMMSVCLYLCLLIFISLSVYFCQNLYLPFSFSLSI